MLEYLKSILFPPKQEKFCYIIGSFAVTAPILRTPESDIDIVCSENMDEFEIRYYLKKLYPSIDNKIKLDVHYVKPDRRIVKYDICYWQEPKSIPLINNKRIILEAIKDGKDMPSLIRDPNKEPLIKYLKTEPILDIGSASRFNKSTKKNCDIDIFNKIIKSQLPIEEQNILHAILDTDGKICSKHLDSYSNIKIDKKNQLVHGKNHSYTYFNFYRQCLGYNIFFVYFIMACQIMRKIEILFI